MTPINDTGSLRRRLATENKRLRELRLSWKGGLALGAGGFLIAWLFDSAGRFDLARPTFVALSAIGVAVALKWRFRRRPLFWVAIVGIAALHVPFIWYIPWTTRWIPAFALMPFGLADLAVIVTLITALETRFDTPAPGETRALEGRR